MKSDSLKKFLLKNKYDAQKVMAPGKRDEEEIESPAEHELEHELGAEGYEHDRNSFKAPEEPLPKYEKGKSMLGKYLKFHEDHEEDDEEDDPPAY